MTDNKNTTLKYYDDNKDSFTNTTVDLEFSDIQDRFLKYLEPGSLILDLGCGPGRDSRYFLNKGYSVEAVDGSEEMVRIARETTGLPVRQMLFSELDETDKYDGVFACASLLHVPSEELPDIIGKVIKALKNNGVFYLSFKYGDFEGYRNDRYFTDYKEDTFAQLMAPFHELVAVDHWISSDARPGRSDEKWLNVIMVKIGE